MRTLLLCVILGAGRALNAQPSNDNSCSTPNIPITYSASLACTPSTGGGSYTGATPSDYGTPPCYPASPINDVYYSVAPTTSGRMVIRFKTPVGTDGVLAVYGALCYPGTPVLACNDDTLGSKDPEVSFEASAGTFYAIRFWIKGATAGTITGICAVMDAPSINPLQKVGIGIANPQANLDVNGTLWVRGGNPGAGKVMTSDAAGRAQWAQPNSILAPPIILNYNNEFNATFFARNEAGGGAFSGLMGTNPATGIPRAALSGYSSIGPAVSGATDDYAAADFRNSSGTEATLQLWNLHNSSDPKAARIFGSVTIEKSLEAAGGGVNNGNLAVFGNLGIGVYPQAGAAVNIQSSQPGKIALEGNPGGVHYGIGVSSNTLMLHVPASGNDIAFGIGSTASFSEVMRLKGDGRVGIGTAAIDANRTLQVVSNGQSVLSLASRGAFGSGALEFVSDFGLPGKWRPGFVQSEDNGNYTGRLAFYTNGVGFANAYNFVKGFQIQNGLAFTSTGALFSFSDERLKTHIEPYTDGLNVVQQLQPIRFEYNELSPFPGAAKQVGISAQQLEKVAPYMVDKTTQNGMDDMRSVNNQAYIFMLINAVKEQQVQIDTLKKEIEKLKKK